MRDPETDRLLQAVRAAVVEARRGGATVRACIWDATVAAVDVESHTWASKEARRTADAACRAVDPPDVMANPTPLKGAGVQPRPKRFRITDDHLRGVAAIYREALAAGAGPTSAVAYLLMVPHSTAAKWVGHARRRGFLPPA